MSEEMNNSVPEDDFYALIVATTVNNEEFNNEEPNIDGFPTLDSSNSVQSEDNTQTQEQNDPQDPKGKRFAYWQSQAMREANKSKQLENQINMVNPYMPIIRYIQENPNVLDIIENSLGGEQPQQEQGIQRPLPPQKPEYYNKSEAFNDPESESFKYREANETYREQLAEYLLNKEQLREEEYKRTQQERMYVEQRNQQIGSVITKLTTQYGFNQSDASEFVQMFDDPKAVTFENLIQLYRFNKGQTTPHQVNPKVQQMLQRQGKNIPLPAGINGGETSLPVSDEDIFNASIHQSAKNQGSVLWRNKQR